MKLNKISLKNIRSYAEKEIVFPEGSTLLSGDIGAGKSSVLLAVEFALFGLQKGKGNFILRNGEKEGTVKLDFETDGKNVIIERNLKRTKDSVQQDEGYMQIDGRKQELSAEELRAQVLKLLNYPVEFQKKNPVLYRYTVYTPQEDMKEILTEDADTRLNTLRKVFAIDRYKRVLENCEKAGRKLREIISNKKTRAEGIEAKKKELDEKTACLEKAKTVFATAKFKLDEIKKISAERRKNVSDIEIQIKELGRLKTEIAGMNSELNAKQESLKENSKSISEYEEQIKKLESEVKSEGIEDVSKEVESIESEKKESIAKRLEIGREITEIETYRKLKEKGISEIIKLDKCPTCRQEVAENYKKGIKEDAEKEIEEEMKRMKGIQETRAELEEKIEICEKKLAELREKDKKFSLARMKISSLNEKKEKEERLEKSQTEMKERISLLEAREKEINAKMDCFKDIEKNYSIARNLFDEIDREERGKELEKARAEKEIEYLKSSVETINKEILEKERIRTEISQISRIESWISEQFSPLVLLIEKNVMAKVHQEFSLLFQKWFSMLAELESRINEEFTPIIEQRGYDIDYQGLSGGERTAAALAYRLALNQIINNLMSHIKTRDLLILDEPTDGFSSEQLDKMRDVLRELKVKQLILVSHESKIESFVDNVIRFEKKDGITSVV